MTFHKNGNGQKEMINQDEIAGKKHQKIVTCRAKLESKLTGLIEEIADHGNADNADI